MQMDYCLIKNLKRRRSDSVGHNLHSPHILIHIAHYRQSPLQHITGDISCDLVTILLLWQMLQSIPLLTSPQVSPAINISERACPRQLVNICQQRRTRGKSFSFQSVFGIVLIKQKCLFSMMQKCLQMSFSQPISTKITSIKNQQFSTIQNIKKEKEKK